MKNLLFTLALLVSFVSFVSFGQESEYGINSEFSTLDKCGEDFFIDDESLIGAFIDLEVDSLGSLYLINSQRGLFGRKLTLHWSEDVEFLYEEYSELFETDRNSLLADYTEESIEMLVYQIKEVLIKISFSQKKINGTVSYNDCGIESIELDRKNKKWIRYNSKENIQKEWLGDVLTITNYNNLSSKVYNNDVLTSDSKSTENSWFNTAYLNGVKDYTEEFNNETGIGQFKKYWQNGNLYKSGDYYSESGPFGTWIFYSKNGNYTASAEVKGNRSGRIKDSVEIYKSGVFFKKVELKNKKNIKLLDLLNELDSDN